MRCAGGFLRLFVLRSMRDGTSMRMVHVEIRRKMKGKRKICRIFLAAAAVCLLVAAIWILYGKYRQSLIPGMSFEEMLAYTTDGENDAVITVGILKDGEASYTVYGENGAVLPTRVHTYEIGSLTKTLTASLVCQAVREGKLALDEPVDSYLELGREGHYPSMRSLLTHTSGYKPYYFEGVMIGNFLRGRNDFYGIGDSMVQKKLSEKAPADKAYPFRYSNFGYAALGLLLEKAYGTEYTMLFDAYCREQLGLAHTKISDGSGDLGNCWDWMPGDTYLAAGGAVSDIEDMLAYAGWLLEESADPDGCTAKLCEVGGTPESYRAMGIRMDAVAYGWILDEENGFIWHNGGTGSYNCYLGVSPQNRCAVVVLSNLSPHTKIPATVMGVRLLEELTGEALP